MLDAPAYTGTEVESVVQDLLTKIHGRELQRQKKMLLGQIKEAERKKQYGVANNAAKELMEEHKKLLVRHN
jgi:translation elongation factor EF-4